MKSIKPLFVVAAALLCFCGCKKVVNVDSLIANFSVSSNPCYAGDEIHFTSTTTGGKKPYEFEWTVDGVKIEKTGEDVKYTFKTNGTYTVILTVVDDLGSRATKKKLVVVDPAPVQATGSLDVKWVGYMSGYNSITTPAIDNDGNVYCATRANILYKFNGSTGETMYEKTLFTPINKGETYASPVIDTDGTVYMACGSANGDAHILSYSSNGTQKWSFSGWYASSGTPAPSYQACLTSIYGNNIYFGNVGTNGIVGSINKSTGKRNGFACPTGGARTGITITKDGYAGWYGGVWGLYAIKTQTLDAGGDSPVSASWGLWNKKDVETYASSSPMGGIAAFTFNGKSCFTGLVTDQKGTRIYVVEAATGEELVKYYIDGAAPQDQGGVVITKEGYIVASLAYTTGQDNGGIIVFDPVSKSAKGRFSVQEKVSGCCAVDNNGNIHFATESGQYYVVDKDCNLILKADIADAAVSKDAQLYADLRVAKIWSSVVISDSGVVHIAFTDGDKRTYGGVIAFIPKDGNGKSICSGASDSEWPMFGHDRRHTNVQL